MPSKHLNSIRKTLERLESRDAPAASLLASSRSVLAQATTIAVAEPMASVPSDWISLAAEPARSAAADVYPARVFVFLFSGFPGSPFADPSPTGLGKLAAAIEADPTLSESGGYSEVITRVVQWPTFFRIPTPPETHLARSRDLIEAALQAADAQYYDKVVLIGHSWGGFVAHQIAANVPYVNRPAHGLVTFDSTNWRRFPDLRQADNPIAGPSGVRHVLNFNQRREFAIQGFNVTNNNNTSLTNLTVNTRHTWMDDDVSGLGRDGKPGRRNFDDDGNGVRDDAYEAGWPGSDDPRLGMYDRVMTMMRTIANPGDTTIGVQILSPANGSTVPTITSISGKMTNRDAAAWPIVAIMPLSMPSGEPWNLGWWVQPIVTEVKQDGTFTSQIYVGESDPEVTPPGSSFVVAVMTVPDRDQAFSLFPEGLRLGSLPLPITAFVTVWR